MAVRRLLVAGRYRLHEPVGAGGMGRVWMARDEMLDRDVAVKEFVPPEWMTDPERDRLRDRTLREARSAARLNHPHVVRIYDVVHFDDLPWIVMEYVDSRSLHQVVAEDGPLTPVETARIGLDVLDALTAAHTAGVLHRDVKPHNVLIGHDGRVVLTDFGLATFVDDGSVTGPGMVVGSPQYVSPERARDGASTVESDLWSLGATLYAAVEGRSPYARDNAMATLTALATEPPDPPTLAGPLAGTLMGLLRYEPGDRLTAAEVQDELREVVAGRDPSGPPPPAPSAGTGSPDTANRPAPVPRPRTPAAVRAGGVRPGAPAGRAAVPSPRSPSDDEPAPAAAARPDADLAAATAVPAPAAGGGLGAALAAVMPEEVGVHDRARTEPAAPEDGASRGAAPQRAGQAAPAPGAPSGDRRTDGRRTGGRPTDGRGAGGRAPDDHAPDDPAGRRSRVTVALVGLLVVVLLGGGGVLVHRLNERGSRVDARPEVSGSPVGSPSSSSATGPGGFSPVVCDGPQPSDLPRTPLAGSRTSLPSRYAMLTNWSYHHDASGIYVAVPDGWTYRRVKDTLCFREPGGLRTLSLDMARKPTADPLVACRTEATRLTRTGALPEYDEVGISAVPYVTKAADWEYSYDNADGDRLHAVTRWFASGTKAYALSWVTRESDWTLNRPNMLMLQASFTTDGKQVS